MTRAVRCGDLPGWADFVASMTQGDGNSRCLEAWRLAADVCVPLEFAREPLDSLALAAWYLCFVRLDSREQRKAKVLERRRGLKVMIGGAS